MRNLIKLTDEQIEEILDDTIYGATIDDAEFTRDSLEDFSNGVCRPFGSTCSTSDIDSSVKILISENLQLTKGQRRFDLMVVDFGEVRAAFRV